MMGIVSPRDGGWFVHASLSMNVFVYNVGRRRQYRWDLSRPGTDRPPLVLATKEEAVEVAKHFFKKIKIQETK